MLLNKHGSFYIRNGWPTKILNAIGADRFIFSPNNELDAVDTIGVGRVMVKAMRYWSVAMGLASEEKTQQIHLKVDSPCIQSPSMRLISCLRRLHRTKELSSPTWQAAKKTACTVF